MTLFVDASALVSIMLDEPDADVLADRLDTDADRVISALALWETMAAVRKGKAVPAEQAWAEVERYRAAYDLRIVAIGEAEAAEAMWAHARYGRNSGHRPSLNMGDCFAYACARTSDARLLYKGDDFARTDLA